MDGTVLDFASTPDGVVVPDELRDALAAIKKHLGGALAFVSGRSLASIDHLFGYLRAAAIGAHGGEIRFSNGRILLTAALPDFVKDLNSRFPGLPTEDKNCAVALDYRHNPVTSCDQTFFAGACDRA
jgi:trehalose 6-phosphate phosphatase